MRATFLGTGNFLAPGRYWNSFVLDGRVLVEPAPTALPHLRRCGIPAEDLDAVLISHFHPDHTFGWPFLLLELLGRLAEALLPAAHDRHRAAVADQCRGAGQPDAAAAAGDERRRARQRSGHTYPRSRTARATRSSPREKAARRIPMRCSSA